MPRREPEAIMTGQTIPAPLPYQPSRTRTDLFSALFRAKKEFGSGKAILIDGDERELTYKEIVQAALALGSTLRKGTKPGEAVGVMLPSGAGAVIGFYAISAFNRIPQCSTSRQALAT